MISRVGKLFFPSELGGHPFFPDQDYGGGDEYGGIGPHQDPDDHGEGEIVDDRSAEEKEGCQDDKDREGGKDGPAQGLVDGFR